MSSTTSKSNNVNSDRLRPTKIELAGEDTTNRATKIKQELCRDFQRIRVQPEFKGFFDERGEDLDTFKDFQSPTSESAKMSLQYYHRHVGRKPFDMPKLDFSPFYKWIPLRSPKQS